MFQSRTLFSSLSKAIRHFPSVVITGPRQSGKTTLLKNFYSSTHSFLSLEDPDVRIRAKEDPRTFLKSLKRPVILDEIQYVPELLSYIKTIIDEEQKPGAWLFTGSQNFVLMQSITQSLAGRAAILSLLPFSYAERIGSGAQSLSIQDVCAAMPISTFHSAQHTMQPLLSEVLLRGHYPAIALKTDMERELWCSSYLSTYLERDIRNLSLIGDLSQFERFVRLCAVRTGQILNVSDMARDIGVTVPTARRWLSLLEAGYQVYLLYPYYRNIGKRLIKRPKLYFTDTALATYLLGIHNEETLIHHSNFGCIFETFVVVDFLKRFYHHGGKPSLYYLRTSDGLEIDLVIELGERLYCFEIKATATAVPKHAQSLQRIVRDVGSKTIRHAALISLTEDSFEIARGIHNYSWREFGI